ncbi:MAG: hypothetical protein E6G67_03095 [Actinobacteria bacterium]|nr:MAG: hypothetical protein E6G67_03095 [Actinomycetota bacterium]
MGGRVGLKGTDGPGALEQARRLGARAEASERAAEALRTLVRLVPAVDVITYAGAMGTEAARAAGLDLPGVGSVDGEVTSREDTHAAVRAFVDAGVDLILFAGGDGTARDVLDAVDDRLPVLGIPAGCKMHSAVFATTPTAAGELAARFATSDSARLALRLAEVMDIDEDAYRADRLSARLYGYLRVPAERRLMQGAKSSRPASEDAAVEAIAADLISEIDEATVYVVGPGTTTRPIFERLGLAKTLLGIDALRGRRLAGCDLNERGILDLVAQAPSAKIIVSVIGTQGYIFGRGNQQLSPQVIRLVGRDNIIVLATREKLAGLPTRRLLVDTGDSETNRLLSGYLSVRTGGRQSAVIRVAAS